MNNGDIVSKNNINKASIERAFETNVRFKYSLSLEMPPRKINIVFEVNDVFRTNSKKNTNKRQTKSKVTLRFSPRNFLISRHRFKENFES